MGVLIVADLPSVRMRATSAMGQDWLDTLIDPLLEDWNEGWLVMPANRAALFASQAAFDRIPITYALNGRYAAGAKVARMAGTALKK